MGALDSVALEHRVQRLDPLFGFLRIEVGLVRLFNHGLGLAALSAAGFPRLRPERARPLGAQYTGGGRHRHFASRLPV